jgi:high-affinity nickel-transport protein
MGLVVGGISLLVAALGLARISLPTVASWSEGKELFFGATVVGLIAGSFFLALWLTRSSAAGRVTLPAK